MNDYISREDVKKLLWGRISLATFMRRGVPNAMKSLSFISEKLEEIPAADVRPVVRGEWIPEADRHYHWHCSKCGYVIGAMRMDADFCLKCGADMTGGADG